MKTTNIILKLFLTIILISSCSSDDDSAEINLDDLFTDEELLVNGSLWRYDNAQVEEIFRNDLDLTTDELIGYAIGNFEILTFNFRDDGTVTISNTESGEQETINYFLLGNTINFNGSNEIFSLQDVVLTETSLSFTVEADQVNGNDTSISSFWSIRVFYD